MNPILSSHIGYDPNMQPQKNQITFNIGDVQEDDESSDEEIKLDPQTEQRLREKEENRLKVPKPKFRQLSAISLIKADDPLESLAKLAALKQKRKLEQQEMELDPDFKLSGDLGQLYIIHSARSKVSKSD